MTNSSSPGAAPRLPTVLIADDDRILGHMLATRLRTHGWMVDLAFDAMQVLMKAMKSAPDVITLDINMPGGTGVEALRKLKASSKTAGIPVVIVSGSIAAADEPAVMALGAAAFVRKPCEPDALAAVLAEVTGRSALVG